jgi:putative hemolysin
MQKSAAQDISYASSVGSRPAQTFVRMVENVTGRRKLIKRAIGYEQDIAAGADFWTVMARRYGLSLEITRGAMGNIPAAGPLILLSNHPFGILDGLMMGYLLSQTRPEFRILANRVFSNAEDINKVILPISFDQTSAAVALNLQTRKDALAYLGQGGAIGVFPGGTVSTASRPFGLPADPGWRTFTAKMIARSEASVVPVFFEGHNSRLFQICSHLHPTLRTALFVKEFERRNDTPVRVAIGDPIPRAGLERHARDPKGLMDFLRSETYKLSASPQAYGGYGFEFESRYRQNRAPVS